MRTTLLVTTTAFITAATTLLALQSQPALVGAQFDVVSIKPHPYDPTTGSGIGTLPDGTFRMRSQSIWSVLMGAAPEPVYEVIGFPDWVRSDAYDIIAKPAPDSHPTPEQRAEMMRNMLIDRFKVAGHLEEVERTTFALVLARSDGRLGPQLKKSSAECAQLPSDPAPPPQSAAVRCGMRMGQGTIEATGMSLDRLVLSFRGLAGGAVTNRTGLDGLYDVSLQFAPSGLNAATSNDDAPQFLGALQEQLGLKLVPEKTKVKIFVVDHIERPTPN